MQKVAVTAGCIFYNHFPSFLISKFILILYTPASPGSHLLQVRWAPLPLPAGRWNLIGLCQISHKFRDVHIKQFQQINFEGDSDEWLLGKAYFTTLKRNSPHSASGNYNGHVIFKATSYHHEGNSLKASPVHGWWQNRMVWNMAA